MKPISFLFADHWLKKTSELRWSASETSKSIFPPICEQVRDRLKKHPEEPWEMAVREIARCEGDA
jgi:hypothetical protein